MELAINGEIAVSVAITVFPDEVFRAQETWARRAFRNLIYFTRPTGAATRNVGAPRLVCGRAPGGVHVLTVVQRHFFFFFFVDSTRSPP